MRTGQNQHSKPQPPTRSIKGPVIITRVRGLVRNFQKDRYIQS